VPASRLRAALLGDQFPQLKPGKSSSGQRLYRRRDVETVVHIKQLLYQDGFTIAGARQLLRSENRSSKNQNALPFAGRPSRDELRQVRQGLKEILGMLSPRR